MRQCCVHHCRVRSSGVSKAKNTKFFLFPKEETLKKAWLQAINRKEEELNMKYAKVCQHHFSPDCMEERWTKPQKKNVEPRIIVRLKAGSIPTLLLDVQSPPRNQRNTVKRCCHETERSNKKCCYIVPTYEELVAYSKNVPTTSNEQNISSDNLTTMECAIEESQSNVQNIFSDNLTTMECAIDESQSEQHQILTPTNEPETEIEKLKRLLNESQEKVKQMESKCGQLEQLLEVKTNDLDVKTKDLEAMKKINEANLEDIDKNRRAEQRTATILNSIFTPGQITKLFAENRKRITWSAEDISSAIALRSLSGRTYKYLREVKQMPLPCESTLRNWAASFDTRPGLLKDVLKIMHSKGENLTAVDKIAVLCFDEIYVSNLLDIERREQRVYGSHKTCQVVMVRGLFSKWKQPIYYKFSQPMTKEILFQIISALYKINYTVVAITSDLGPKNMGLWSELNIDCRSDKVESTCFFQHPQNHALKIFVFADVPHLIKLLRNHFFDSGFEINGQLYTKRLLEELLALNSRDLKIAFNLTQKHLDVRNQQRQSVKLAAQIFSRRNALAIKYCGEHGFFSEDQTWDELSKMLLLINDWFDVCNSQGKYGQHGTQAYGVDLKNQDEIFDKMSRFVLNLRVKRKSHLLPFQKGILLTNASLKGLLQYLKETYSSDIFRCGIIHCTKYRR